VEAEAIWGLVVEGVEAAVSLAVLRERAWERGMGAGTISGHETR
jgi:hypothetical protein